MSKNIFLDYVKAGYPLLWVSTYEEFRAMTTFAKELGTHKVSYNIYTWDRVDGIIRKVLAKGILTSKEKIGDNVVEPLDVLNWADTLEGEKSESNSMPECSILFLKDFHHYAKKDVICRKIKNLIPILKSNGKVLVILSHTVDIPPEIEKDITVINYKLPTTDELKIVLKGLCESVTQSSSNGTKVEYPKKEEDAIIDAALGMTAFEAENAFSVSMVEAKCFDPAIIRREKAAIVKKTNLLEVVESDLSLKDVGGLNNLKAWLEARKNCFTGGAKAFGIKPPRGLLLVGLPGTGKSLTAKCVSSILKRPLLRFDVSKIFQKYVGESEDNMRKSLHIAEAISPCVLWTDELEKAFAGGSDSSGTSQRILGTFLTWMTEKTADVFVVATANDVSTLPAALLRGGRFDAIFWVDIPDEAQRAEIIKIHLDKIGRKSSSFDITKLVAASAKFTGAEIEVWVKESLIYAFSQGEELETKHLMDKKNEISLISNLMSDQIKESQEWAKKHGVKQAYIPETNQEYKAQSRRIDL